MSLYLEGQPGCGGVGSGNATREAPMPLPRYNGQPSWIVKIVLALVSVTASVQPRRSTCYLNLEGQLVVT